MKGHLERQLESSTSGTVVGRQAGDSNDVDRDELASIHIRSLLILNHYEAARALSQRSSLCVVTSPPGQVALLSTKIKWVPLSSPHLRSRRACFVLPVGLFHETALPNLNLTQLTQFRHACR